MLCLSTFFAHSQQLEIEIIDSEDSTAIPLVHIYNFSNQSGTVTNFDGKVLIGSGKVGVNDSIVISCVGYKTKSINGGKFKKSLNIYLERDTKILNSVVITDLSARDIIVKCIDRLPENHKRGADKLIVNHWNTSRLDGTYQSIKSVKSLINYPELVPVDNEILFELHSEQHSDHDEIAQFTDVLSLTHVLSKRAFFNPENIDAWRYKIIGEERFGNENYYHIEATYFDPTGSIEHNILIFINQQNYGIAKLKFSYYWKFNKMKKMPISKMRYALNQVDGTLSFYGNKGHYQLASLFVNLEYDFFPLFSDEKRHDYNVYHEMKFGKNLDKLPQPLNVELYDQVKESFHNINQSN